MLATGVDNGARDSLSRMQHRVLDGYFRIWIDDRYRQRLLSQQIHVFCHANARLVDAILDRMTDSTESVQLRREEREKVRIMGGLDDERVGEVDHLEPLSPAAFKIA